MALTIQEMTAIMREDSKEEIEALYRRLAEIREEEYKIWEKKDGPEADYDEDDPELYYEQGLLIDEKQKIYERLAYLEDYAYNPHFPDFDNALYTYPEDTSTPAYTDGDPDYWDYLEYMAELYKCAAETQWADEDY